jgi:hypothetical protein
LDLVVNNLEDLAGIYRNNSTNNYINIKLVGDKKNINAIGAKVKVFTDKSQQYQEMFLARGYQSSMSPILNFGLGDEEVIKRVEIVWGNDKVTIADNIKANRTITFEQKDANSIGEIKQELPRNFTRINPNTLGVNYLHNEKSFDDFTLQVLLPQKQSQQGPAFVVGDVNNDGLEDIFLDGDSGQAGELFLQNQGGTFTKLAQPAFEKDKAYEDNGAHFFDADGDGDLDLYVASAGYELKEGSFLLQDRLYINDGKGSFNRSDKLSKMLGNTKAVVSFDYDGDGDMDYFVGNLGGNNKFHPTKDKPLHIYGNNFDDDGNYDMILSKLYNGNLVPVRGKECSTSQNPFVSEKIKTYKEFANSSLADIYGSEVLEASYHKEAQGFESVFIENKGNGTFEVKHLPSVAQFGPTMSFVFMDINGDGHLDVLGSGAIHESEVETVRYDSNIGYILLGDSKGGLKPYRDVSFYNDYNAKHMKVVNIQNKPHIFIANNNMPLTIFRLNNK